MINKLDLLDPNALEKRSKYEREVVEGAHNAGHSPPHIDLDNSTGVICQVLNASAIRAAEFGAPGGDSDISDGVASLAESLDPTSSSGQ